MANRPLFISAEEGVTMRCSTLLPALLVVVLAIIGPRLDHHDPCQPSDGPQFQCWLEHR